MGNNKPEMTPYTPPTMTKAEGFFNRPVIGDRFAGILVGEVRKNKHGVEIEKPFYVFKLTEPFAKATNQPEDPNSTEAWPTFTLNAGQCLGVRAWVGLMGISEKMGHVFEITYTGDRKLEGGKTQKVFAFLVSKSPVEVSAPSNVSDEADDDEIPFDNKPAAKTKGKTASAS